MNEEVINSLINCTYVEPKMTEEEKNSILEKAREVYERTNNILDTEKDYKGTIKKIYYRCKYNFEKIIVIYDVYDNGRTKTASDEYTFGGEHDDYYLQQLMTFIKQIDGLKFEDIDFSTYKSITKSLQFLVGATVTLSQYVTSKNTIKNNVIVHGTFNLSKN